MNSNSPILCYVRPWNEKQFVLLANEIWPERSVIQCSEHPKIDRCGLYEYYYGFLKNGIDIKVVDKIEKEIRDDIISRCRLLRSLSTKESKRHFYAMASAVLKVLDTIKPEYFISVTIDSYILDLFKHFCDLKKIYYCGLIPSFVNGYFRITARGEKSINLHSDSNLYLSLEKTLLDPLYTPAFNAKSLQKPRRLVFKRWLSNVLRIPYFYSKRLTCNDNYNYHFWSSQVVSQFNLSLLPTFLFGDDNWQTYLNDKPSIFIPLQMFPECTVDYWCEDIKSVNYYDSLNKLIDNHSEEFNIFIKEHPSVQGSRPHGFYSALSKDKRVTVIPTYTSANYVVELMDSVLVWTGTVGFEAALRGKPVFMLSRPYYFSGIRMLNISTDTKSNTLKKHIDELKCKLMTKEEQSELLNSLTQQLFHGQFHNDGSWDESDIKHVQNIKNMAKVITRQIL